MKSAKSREEAPQEVKPKGSSFIVDFKPAFGSYVFFAIFVGVFVLGGLWGKKKLFLIFFLVYKILSKMD
jgi:hypothetical protein